MAKKTATFEKQIRIPLMHFIEKTSYRQKRNTNELFLQILFYADMTTMKRDIFQQKNPKIIHSWLNQFWSPIANLSVKVQYDKTSI